MKKTGRFCITVLMFALLLSSLSCTDQITQEEKTPLLEEKTIEVGSGAKLSYKDYVEMEVGGLKGIIFTLDTEDTELSGKEIDYTLLMKKDDSLVPTTDVFDVVQHWTHHDPNSEKASITVLKIRAITGATSFKGKQYELWVQLSAEGVGIIDQVPLVVNVIKSSDDIIPAPGMGPTYRGNIQGPGGENMSSVEQASVLIDNSAWLTYLDYVEAGIGGIKTVIFSIGKYETPLEGLDLDYTLGRMENGEFKPLPEEIKVSEKWSRGSPDMDRHQKTYVTIATSPEIAPGDYILYVQVTAEGRGVIDYVPLTLRILEADDDIVLTDDGPKYRIYTEIDK